MKSVKVLVTAIGGPTALGILKCLSNIDGLELFGVDAQSFTAGNMYCKRNYVIAKLSDVDEYVATLKRIIQEEKIDIVFPTLQDEIAIFLRYRNDIDCEIALPKSDFYDALLNKKELYSLLIEKGMGYLVPNYFMFNDNSDLKKILSKEFEKNQNVCVKNIQGHGGIGVIFLTDKENYIKSLNEGKKNYIAKEDYIATDINSERMVMDFLEGEEISVDLFLYEGKVVTAVSRKRNRVVTGIVIDGIVAENKDVIEKATLVAEAVASDGFLNIQFIGSKNGYKLTDLNPRFCGSQVMSFGAGVNFPNLLIQYWIKGNYIVPKPAWGTRMLRYWDCCFCNN